MIYYFFVYLGIQKSNSGQTKSSHYKSASFGSTSLFPLDFEKEKKVIIEDPPDLHLRDDTIIQGSVTYYELTNTVPVEKVMVHGSVMPYVEIDSVLGLGLLAVDVESKVGWDTVFVHTRRGNIFSYPFYVDTLYAGIRDRGMRDSDTSVLAYNKAMMIEAKSYSPDFFYNNEEYLDDIKSLVVTSPFGRTRLYHVVGHLDQDSVIRTRHRGKDLRSPVGTDVESPNYGVVVFSGSLDGGWGNTMLIDYGEHVFYIIMHLSERNFEFGDFVQRGEVIAESGWSGLPEVGDAHLHCAFHFDKETVDPFVAIDELNFLYGKVKEHKVQNISR